MSTTQGDASALGPPPSYDSVMQGEVYPTTPSHGAYQPTPPHGAYQPAPPHGAYQPAPPYPHDPGLIAHPHQPYNPPNIGYVPYGMAPPPQTIMTQASHVQTYPTTVINPTGQQVVPDHSRRRIMAILLVIFLPLCLFIIIYLFF